MNRPDIDNYKDEIHHPNGSTEDRWRHNEYVEDLEKYIDHLEQKQSENVVLDGVSERPKFVKCSVTGLISVNQTGSSVGGGFWEYLYADEVAKLGINPNATKNADMVEGVR